MCYYYRFKVKIETLTKLPAVRTPCVHFCSSPANRRSLASRDSTDNLASQTADLPRSSLYRLFHTRSQTRRGVQNVSELREAVQAPTKDFTSGGDCQGVILAERKREDSVGELRDGYEAILRVLPRT